jgi:phasin family protein
MIKVEDIQQYGKEHMETVVASATSVQSGLQAIASAYGDYTKKSFEDTKSFVEKLSGVKSLEKAMEMQTEYAKSAYETFVAESQKIAGLYTDLAKQTFKPLEGMVAKFTPAAAHSAILRGFKKPGRCGRAFSLRGPCCHRTARGFTLSNLAGLINL